MKGCATDVRTTQIGFFPIDFRQTGRLQIGTAQIGGWEDGTG